jgi:PKD repeat protein
LELQIQDTFLIGDEIISYTAVTGSTLGGTITRGQNPQNYPTGTPVYKYELSGVSLNRINTTHYFGNVTVFVTDWIDEVTDTTTVTVDNVAPITELSAVIQNKSVSFDDMATDQGSDDIKYTWDFGDNTTSTDENPSHAYNSSGKFAVSLTVTDDKGNTATDTRTDYITVQSGWNVGNIAKAAVKGLTVLGQVIVNILIWVGIFSPVWIIGGGIGYWIWRRKKAFLYFLKSHLYCQK